MKIFKGIIIICLTLPIPAPLHKASCILGIVRLSILQNICILQKSRGRGEKFKILKTRLGKNYTIDIYLLICQQTLLDLFGLNEHLIKKVKNDRK